MTDQDDFPRALLGSWHGFLETFAPLRSDLYRYCRHLTRSPWDAEDLVQDTLARGFATLGQMGRAPAEPRAWLFRVASNLWIDQLRRRRQSDPLPITLSGERSEAQATREAAGTLLGQLSPQERAAVVLKDVFDFSLEEVAETLSTSVGAIKTALHRGREKLVEPRPDPVHTPPPPVLDAFCAAFNAHDLDALTALLLDSSCVEVVGATTMYGPAWAKQTALWGMLFGVRRLVQADTKGGIEARFMQGIDDTLPRVEVREHRGRHVLVHWYTHEDGEAVRALTLVDCEGVQVAHLRNYFFTPELIEEVCAELALPFRSNGHRWSLPKG